MELFSRAFVPRSPVQGSVDACGDLVNRLDPVRHARLIPGEHRDRVGWVVDRRDYHPGAIDPPPIVLRLVPTVFDGYHCARGWLLGDPPGRSPSLIGLD